MAHPSNTGSGGSANYFPPEEQSVDQLIEQAVQAASKGENIEQLLEAMQGTLPASMKDAVRKKFSQALAKKGLKTPGNDPADVPSRRTLARIREALAVSSRQMMDRIKLLVRIKPDVASRIQEAGRILVKNGVMQDKVSLTEADLGTMAPSAARSSTQDRGQQGR